MWIHLSSWKVSSRSGTRKTLRLGMCVVFLMRVFVFLVFPCFSINSLAFLACPCFCGCRGFYCFCFSLLFLCDVFLRFWLPLRLVCSSWFLSFTVLICVLFCGVSIPYCNGLFLLWSLFLAIWRSILELVLFYACLSGFVTTFLQLFVFCSTGGCV